MADIQTSTGTRDNAAALAIYRYRAPFYDHELVAFEPLRQLAVDKLRLQPGQTVIDVGCGTGLSFGLLEAAIGPAGRIIAIEQSPDMMDVARRRVADNGWDNIKLIQACAEEASWRGQADALLMHFTHDIVRCQRTLDHLLGHLKPGATVVSTGLKWALPWCVPVNLYVLSAALYSVSSLEGLAEPWTLLTHALEDFQLEDAIWGGGYVASGRYAPPATR